MRSTTRRFYGYFLAAVFIGVPVMLLRYIIPFFDAGLDDRLKEARDKETALEHLQDEAKKVEQSYKTLYEAPLAVALEGLTLRTVGELVDHLQERGLVTRRQGQVRVLLTRMGANARDPLLQFCYPTLQFERFRLELDGSLEDVLDYMRQEVESLPFYMYSRIAVAGAGQKGAWPRYVFEVWLPVDSSKKA